MAHRNIEEGGERTQRLEPGVRRELVSAARTPAGRGEALAAGCWAWPIRRFWAQRVAGWKASGLTSPEFCKDKPFPPGGLRHMAFRLERGAPKKPATVRQARLVRVPAREIGSSPGVGVMIELGRTRVAVPPGVDQRTLATVVEVLSAVATRNP